MVTSCDYAIEVGQGLQQRIARDADSGHAFQPHAARSRQSRVALKRGTRARVSQFCRKRTRMPCAGHAQKE